MQYIMTEQGERQEEIKWTHVYVAAALVALSAAVFLWRALHELRQR